MEEVEQLPVNEADRRMWGDLLDALSRGPASHTGPDDGRRLRFAVGELVNRIPGMANTMMVTVLAYVSIVEAMRADDTVVVTFQGDVATIAPGPGFDAAWAEWSAGRAGRLAEELYAEGGFRDVSPSQLRAQRILEALARQPERRSPRVKGRSSITSWLVGQIEGDEAGDAETRLYHATVETLAGLGLIKYEGVAPAISVAWVTDAGMEKLFWLRWLQATDRAAYLAELATL